MLLRGTVLVSSTSLLEASKRAIMADASQNSRSAELVTASIVTVVLSGLAVVLRYVTRLRILKFLGNEDICIGIAYVSTPYFPFQRSALAY